ncbi:hypothetical protein ONZ45_g6567 [Pleurotus djamor]|nr:hypothetical protein ONZ45_g6567 [Pleurotus djamor]
MFTAINPFSRGQPQPPPPTQLQTQKAISDQVRQEWHEFESAWFKPQQSTMERRCAEKFKELDKAFRASTAAATTPVASSSKSKKRSTNNNTNTTNNSAAAKAAAKEHESKKVQVREELRKELVLKAREEWQRRLAGKGLRDDDWADMSVDEQGAVERALGGDFEEDDEDDSEQEMTFSQMQAPMMSTAAVGSSLFPSLSSLPLQPAASSLAAVAGPSSNSRTTLPSLQTLQTNVAPAPSLSSATRSTNASTASSSYAFVNPSSLGKPARVNQPEVDDDDDDDETSPFEDIGFVYDAMKRKSDYRDAYDTPTGSSSFSGTNSGWSTDLSLSTHTSHTSSPEQPAPRTIPPMDKDGSMPGSWFAAKEKDASATPTTATVKGSKSGWGIAAKSNGKGNAPAQPATSTSTIPSSSTTSTTSTSNNNASSSSARAPTSSSASEEADFENYKMDVRIAKIREFHEEAAAADEYLIREIFRARKLWKLGCYDEEIDMGDEGRDIERGSMEYTDILRKRREKKCWEVECRRIEEHERTMVNLRKLKEDERRGIVEQERKRRREAIRGQQQQLQQQRGSVVGQQQQRKEREAREREAKEEAAREREREIMMKEKEMREREIAWMGSKATSGHGSSTSLFAPPSQISLEHSASSFASAFNNTSVSTSLFTPTPATTMVDPFSASFHQQSQPSFNATNASTKPTISLFPEEEEYAIDEAKIASMLASQMQMAQKFDGWSSGSGGSKGGSPRSLGEGGTPLPATTTTTGNETKGMGSSTMSAKVELSSTTKATSSADSSKKGEAEKVKEEKGQVKKGPSSLTPTAAAKSTPAPTIAITSSSESEPKSEPAKVVPATGKNAKKKGKKGQAAVPVPTPAPAPTPVKEAAKAPAKVEAAKTPAKVETTTIAKGKTASPPVKEVPSVPTKSGKVETKTPAKKDDTPISTTSSSSTSNATSPGPTAKVSSIWGKKEEPAAKAKKEETTSAPPTSISQPTKTAPTPTRWKVSLFDDEPTPAPAAVPSKSTMDPMTSSSSSSAFAAKHGLQPPPTQSFWHPPGTNSGVARSSSDQPGGGLKAPEPSSVARAASDQPVNKMSSSSSSSMAAQKSVPERWLPPQAKQQQQPQQPTVAQPQPQPWDRKPTNASFARTRRMSEPAPPSPVDPAFFTEAAKASNGRSAEVKDSKNAPTSTTTKSTSKVNGSTRGKTSRKTAVVVEDASDDEEDQDGVGEALALDSRYIMEENPGIVRPKPSVAGKMFNNIFDYEEDDSGSSTTEVPSSFAAGGEGMMMKDAPSWDTLAKSTKAKHVRWTPSTLGNSSPISFGGDEETASVNIESFLQTATSTLASGGMPTQAPPQGRGRTSSVSHASGGFKGWGQTVPASAFGGGMGGGAVADMDVMGKGKGVDRGSFSKQDASEEMGWYTKGAMESLKQMRSKPASAV